MRTHRDEPALLLAPSGRLDVDTCGAVRHQLGAAFAAGVRSVVVDLQAVTAVDPIGLGVLAGAAKYLRRKGGALVLTHANAAVQKTLRINELTDLLLVPPSPPMRGLPVPDDAPAPATATARRPRTRTLLSLADKPVAPSAGAVVSR